MTRQYIGARYVPRFRGLYDVTTQYEGLDVVDNGSGTSYIARKIVPAGTPLTNTEYWFVYGASSGAIVDLQSRVGDLENLLDGNVDTANIKDDAITNAKIADNSITKDKLADRYVICVGDSYQAGYDPAGSNAGWGWYLLHTYGLNGHNIAGVGGAGFGHPENSYFDPKRILMDNPPTDIAHDRVTDIIAGFGYNDFKTLPVNQDAGIARFVTYCKSEYPNANIWLAPIGWAWTNNEDNVTPSEMMNTFDSYIDSCATKDITIMSSCFGLLLGCNGMSSADYKHPTENGNRFIAAAMYAALNGQPYTSRSSVYNIGISGNGYTGNLAVVAKTSNGVIALHTALAIEYSGDAIQLSYIQLPIAHHPFMIAGSGIVGDLIYADKYRNTAVSLMFRDTGAVELQMNVINDTGNNFVSNATFNMPNARDFHPLITAIAGQK